MVEQTLGFLRYFEADVNPMPDLSFTSISSIISLKYRWSFSKKWPKLSFELYEIFSLFVYLASLSITSSTVRIKK